MAINFNGQSLEALSKARIKIQDGDSSTLLDPISFRVDRNNVVMGFETVKDDFGNETEKPIMLGEYSVSKQQIDELFNSEEEASK